MQSLGLLALRPQCLGACQFAGLALEAVGCYTVSGQRCAPQPRSNLQGRGLLRDEALKALGQASKPWSKNICRDFVGSLLKGY